MKNTDSCGYFENGLCKYHEMPCDDVAPDKCVTMNELVQTAPRPCEFNATVQAQFRVTITPALRKLWHIKTGDIVTLRIISATQMEVTSE